MLKRTKEVKLMFANLKKLSKKTLEECNNNSLILSKKYKRILK